MTDTSQYASDIASLPVDTQQQNLGPVLGTLPGTPSTLVDPAELHFVGGAGRIGGTGPAPVYADTVFGVVQGLDPLDRGRLAIDMFVNAPGAYSSIDHVFDENGNLDMKYFQQALDNTLAMAGQYGPDKYGSGTGQNSEYLQILLGDPSRDPGEILTEFQALQAKREAELASGSGRVINYIDPVALAQSASNAFESVTGRKATASEQRAFVKQIHNMQASGATGIQVGAQAQQFANNSSPVEAKGMQYASAASALKKAIGF